MTAKHGTGHSITRVGWEATAVPCAYRVLQIRVGGVVIARAFSGGEEAVALI